MRGLNNIYVQETRNLNEIKEDIKKLVSSEVLVQELNKQTGRVLNEYTGVVKGVYNNIFTIAIPKKNTIQNKSFAITDIQVGIVVITKKEKEE